MKHPSHRRQARELALQVLFQNEINGQMDISKSIDYFRQHFKSDEEVMNYSKALVEGVLEFKNKIDTLLEKHSQHWKLSRMALVDRNLLRLATFEILYLNQKDVDPATAIDEAVDISKKYGNQDSSSFINGILDAILKNEWK